ncbi:hypothetical protein BDF14DRAFT_1960241 [Spinellus fusiger]|nr:hypothetical protein BDF14DRAFT_1960241 [Spinellus fusiger]
MRASILRKERTSLNSSQTTDSRLPALSGPSPSKTIKKPSGEPSRPGTSTTRPPVATLLPLKTPNIQPRRQNPIMSRSTQPEQPDTTTNNSVATGSKKKSVGSLNTHMKKRLALDTKELNHPQERTKAIVEPSKLKINLEGDVLGKEVQTLEVAERVDDLETEEQEKVRKDEENIKSFKLQKGRENISHEKDPIHLKENEQSLKGEKINIEEELVALEAKIQHHATEHKDLQESLEKPHTSHPTVQGESEVLNAKVEIIDKQFAHQGHIIKTVVNDMKEEKKRSEESEPNVLAEEDLQEGKENIRVFCRVRPVMESKKRNPNLITDIKFCGEDNNTIQITEKSKSILGRVPNKKHSFSFDQIFSPESTQKECYEEISHLVQLSIEGHNICQCTIFLSLEKEY